MLDVRGRRCIVVGGGAVARRKVDGLLDAGAAVTVVAPDTGPMPAGVTVLRRPFQPDDVAGALLVFAATNDPQVNTAVAAAATARDIPVNVADDPSQCSMLVPAVVRRGALLIAISTGGASPLLARRIRHELEAAYGAEYEELVELLWQLRQAWEPRAMAAGLPEVARRAAWAQVLDLPLIAWVRDGQHARAREDAVRCLETALGASS